MNTYVVSHINSAEQEVLETKIIDAENEMAAGFEFIQQHNASVSRNVIIRVRPVEFGSHVLIMCLNSENLKGISK